MTSPRSPNFLDWFLRQRKLLHILFWMIVLIYFILGYAQQGKYKLELFRSLAFLPNHIWMVYIFFYFLIPRFLLRNKMFAFFGLGLVIIAINMYFSYLINFKFLASQSIQKSTFWSLGSSLIGCLSILGIAISIKLLRYWYEQKNENLLIHQEKTSTELQMLKSQVHPHFLFNTLNNLYSLTLEKSDLAPIILLKLSDLLRYMLYDCNAMLVLLSKEINMMDNYIELEKIRYGDRLDVSKNYSGDITGKSIPPLLFLPLLENCFKHGTSKQIEQCWLNIHLNADENSLQLKLINSKIRDRNIKPVSGGIGLRNVEKRLQLLYGDNYILKILRGEEDYTVSVSIPLDDQKRTPEFHPEDTKSAKHEYQMPFGG